MISRKSTKLLTDIYLRTFSSTRSVSGRYGNKRYQTNLLAKELYEFLYENDYPVVLLQKVAKYNSAYYDSFRSFLLGINTGETFAGEASMAECQAYGQQLLISLTRDIFREFETHTDSFGVFAPDSDVRKRIKILKSQLEIDGYVYRDKQLYASESSVIDESAEQDYLKALGKSVNLSDMETISHHLDLSEEHYVSGKHDDSISNSRKVLDAILNQVAMSVYQRVNNKSIPPEMLKNATDIRGFLERQNLLTKVEREALEKVYGALSATGGHPYIAEKDQARLMRHLALTFSQFVLLRYQGYLSSNSLAAFPT